METPLISAMTYSLSLLYIPKAFFVGSPEPSGSNFNLAMLSNSFAKCLDTATGLVPDNIYVH